MSADAAAAGRDFLKHLLDATGHKAEVSVEEAGEETYRVKLDGDVAGLGRKQDLVGALSQLTGQVISRHAEARARCVLDIGGQLDARKALLEIAADDVAATVEFTGRRAIIDGLGSTERRIVHGALTDDDRVATRSEGDGEHRLLLIEKR